MLEKDTKLAGLYKRTGSTCSTWVVKARQKSTGRVVTLTLARTDVLTPVQARAAAKQHLASLSAGENPNETRKRKQRPSSS